MNKKIKKMLGVLLSVSMAAGSIALPMAASADEATGTITVDGTKATVRATTSAVALVAKYSGGALTSVTQTPVTANTDVELTVAEGDKVMLWNKLDGTDGATPLADAKVVEAEQPPEEPEELNILQTWKFDFGAAGQTAEDGWTAVDPTKNFLTDGDYGFIGIDNQYLAAEIGPRFDGFDQKKGQVIHLQAGGGEGLADGIGSTGDDGQNNDGATYYPTRFAMKVDDETYYRIKATVTTLDPAKPATASLYTERKHPLYTEKTIPAGETVTTEFTIRVTPIYYEKSDPKGSFADEMVNVSVLGPNSALASLEINKIDTSSTLWVLGDSTVTDGGGVLPFFPLQNYTGVGTGLTKYLPKNIAMVNEGEGGLSATDSYHFNMVKNRIKAGDYLYVEYGHNHKNNKKQGYSGEYWQNNYVSALKKYYEACKTPAGNSDGETGVATLVVVGPIDRHNDSQYDSGTNTWSTTLKKFSDLGKNYVDCLKYGGESVADAYLAKWAAIKDEAEANTVVTYKTDGSGEVASSVTTQTEELTKLKAEADQIVADARALGTTQISNVAFVDLNQPTLDWLKTVSASGTVKDTAYTNNATLSNFYFQTPKSGSTDGTHPNDTGAENLAYYFFTEADDTKYPALTPLLKNFKNGASHETPTPVSAAIMNQGWPGSNSPAWPSYLAPSGFEYPIAIKNIVVEDGTFKTLSYRVQEMFDTYYAVGVVDIYDEGGSEIKRTYTTTDHIDNTNGTGTGTLEFSSTCVLNEGEEYKAYMWPIDTEDSHRITTTENPDVKALSAVYVPTDIEEYLLPGSSSDIEDFSYILKNDLYATGKYVNRGGGVATTEIKTDASDGRKYADINITSKGNSFFITRAFENLDGGTKQRGVYLIDVDMKYVSGLGARIGFAESVKNSSPYVNNEFQAFTIENNGEVKLGGTVTAGTLDSTNWRNVHYILDMNTGTATLSVGGGDTKTIDVTSYQGYKDISAASTLTQFDIGQTDRNKEYNILISNLTVAKLRDSGKTTITAVADEGSGVEAGSYGVVYIDTKGTTSKTVTTGEDVTLTAEATANGRFTGWYLNDELYSNDEAITVRAYKAGTFTAKFTEMTAATNVIVNYLDADDQPLKTASTITTNTLNEELHTGMSLTLEDYHKGTITKLDSETNLYDVYTFDSAASDATTIASLGAEGTNVINLKFTKLAKQYAYYDDFSQYAQATDVAAAPGNGGVRIVDVCADTQSITQNKVFNVYSTSANAIKTATYNLTGLPSVTGKTVKVTYKLRTAQTGSGNSYAALKGGSVNIAEFRHNNYLNLLNGETPFSTIGGTAVTNAATVTKSTVDSSSASIITGAGRNTSDWLLAEYTIDFSASPAAVTFKISEIGTPADVYVDATGTTTATTLDKIELGAGGTIGGVAIDDVVVEIVE